VRKLRGAQAPEAHPVIVTEPAQEAQVDYGSGPMVRHPQTGKYRRTRLFVLTLGYSRKAVRLLVFYSNSRTWAELHEKAFRRIDIGKRLPAVPVTPPYVRVRIGRFGGLSDQRTVNLGIPSESK
jgi:hypothetical protein